MIKDATRAAKIIENSDGAKVDVEVMDDLISNWFHGNPDIDLDEVLSLNKQAIDHLQQVRRHLKKELVA